MLTKQQEFDVKGNIYTADVSVDGKKLAFVSRGELFVSDVEGKFVTKIERGNSERVTDVKWLPDNKSLIFGQTLGGYTNWYTIDASKPSKEKLITNDKQSDRELNVNKDHSKGVYLSGRNEVRLIDLKTLESKTGNTASEDPQGNIAADALDRRS